MARAQGAQKRVIGFLGAITPAADGPRLAAFIQRLRELGWIEGRNLTIEVRWAEGRGERFDKIAAEFVQLKVDVIVTHTTPPVLAAKKATSIIPIVFAAAGDPVGTGAIASLSRPGGNVTGLSSQHTDTAGKRLEFLREAIPHLRRIAVLVNVGSAFALLELKEVQVAARTLGIDLEAFDINEADDIASAFELLKHRADALYVVPDPLTNVNRARIITLALASQMPTMHGFREFVESGGLISYGPNWTDMFRRAGDYVDRVLRGAAPNDMPVEQPSKFDLVINLKSAKVLGIIIPTTLLARADEVIE